MENEQNEVLNFYELGLTRNLFTNKEKALEKRENILYWVNDLETTEVLQGKGVLSRTIEGKQYDCCLGRACWLWEDEFTRIFREDVGIISDYHFLSTDRPTPFVKVLPEKMMGLLALKQPSGEFCAPDTEVSSPISFGDNSFNTLAGLNDEGVTFKEIAQFIRGSFKGCTGEDL